MRSALKYEVITGYALVVVIMIIGLLAVYRNLVRFSETRLRNEDLSELLIVGNVINQLYEVESTQNLYTAENAANYYSRYSSIRPEVDAKIDSLKLLSKDSLRVVKLDTIGVLLDEKEENLMAIAVLLDSLSKAPEVIRQTVSTIVPRQVNDKLKQYVDRVPNVVETAAESDTVVVKGKKKGLLKRIGDAVKGKQDSTLIIKNRTVTADAGRENIRLAIDTVVNIVRHTERLNLENQRKFQTALLMRQSSMTHTNHLLTARIDDLLKSIEKEEIDKSIRLIEEREATLNHSSKIVLGVSLLAFLIALVFGVLFLMDVNRSQRYRRRLEESNLRINQLLQSREKLMMSISHDIKAPMSSILGYVELMESGTDEDTRRIYLSNMKKSGNHVLQLVTNLLDYQKIESGTWMRKEMNFNLHDLVEATLLSFKPLAEKKQLEYVATNRVPEDLDVFSDPFMLREICSNLISNAIKYTVEGRVEVVAGSPSRGDRRILEFSVKDTGPGIDKDYQEYIFQEFTQIRPERIDQHVEGSGLGLAITRGLVEELGGEVNLQSEKGAGSQFDVIIPLEPTRMKEPIQDEGDPDAEKEAISVLVVDDDPVQLTMMSGMLRLKRINVVTEVDPFRVLEIVKSQLFDLIFMDIQMPHLSGFMLVKKIRESGVDRLKSAPIIALSARSDLSSADFRQSGFTDFLNKPFTSAQLFSVIDRYLNGESASRNMKGEKPAGIEMLFKEVKDDPESILLILRTFVVDTGNSLEQLKSSIRNNDQDSVAHIAHKILPLFMIIGDELLSERLRRLERKEPVGDEEKWRVTERIGSYIDEAREMVRKMENGK